MRQSAGFTLIELVVVIVILGVISAVAIPRMSGMNDYKALAFRDAVSSGLRYAQKTATSHRRLVCATFDPAGTTMTLAIAASSPAVACGVALPLPNGDAAVVTKDAANAAFNPVPAALFFQPDGRITTDSAGTVFPTSTGKLIMIAGQTNVAVEGPTGYVQ